MGEFRFGIVGCGMIAGVIASAIRQAEGAALAAVASRRPESARAFARDHSAARVFDTWQELVASDAVDGVYVATPTAVREAICVAAASNGKHVLGDKPFASHESLQRIAAAARAHGVAFMDATHFTHHPRTALIKATQRERIGRVQAVRSTFFYPLEDRDNIRFDPDKEPTGAVGDMAWYNMRAITEFLQPDAGIAKIDGDIVRDRQTGAVVRGAGVVCFEDGKSSTFDFGYNAGVCLMDLDILGEAGLLRLDDFVQDWKYGSGTDNDDHVVGYTWRSGVQSPQEFGYVSAESDLPQSVHMVRNFMALAADPVGERADASIDISGRTQNLLDRFWENVR